MIASATRADVLREVRRSRALRRALSCRGLGLDSCDRTAENWRRTLETLEAVSAGKKVSFGKGVSIGLSGGLSIPVTSGLVSEFYWDTGITVDGSDNVTAWDDQSVGNDVDFVTGSITLVADGVRINNVNSRIGRNTLVGGSLTNATIISVSRKTTTGVGSGTVLIQSANDRHRIGIDTSGNHQLYDGSPGPLSAAGGDTNFHVRVGFFKATDELWIDGTQVISGDAGASSMTGWMLGHIAGASAISNHRAFFIYDRILGTTEREAMEVYAAARTGI